MRDYLTVFALIGGLFIAGPASAAKAPRPPDPCDRKELSVDDVRDILAGKATINHYSMSESNPGEGCSIGVTGNGWALVDISIREGDVQSFQNLIFFVPPPRTSVPGIGDDGEKLVIPATDGAVATKLGVLCKKLFAAHAGT